MANLRVEQRVCRRQFCAEQCVVLADRFTLVIACMSLLVRVVVLGGFFKPQVFGQISRVVSLQNRPGYQHIVERPPLRVVLGQ